MIIDDVFTIPINGPALNRNDFRRLSSERIYRLISSWGHLLRISDTEDERCEAEFALQELRAVLQERT